MSNPRTSHPRSPSHTPGAERLLALRTRLLLTVAAVQHLADASGIRILHVKGVAAEQVLARRSFSDVDILVDPRAEDQLLASMAAAGWARGMERKQRGFEAHATDMVAEPFGVKVDVHHHFPGIGLPPQAAFEALWDDRVRLVVAGRDIAIPSPTDNRIVVALHGARSTMGSKHRHEAQAVRQGLPATVVQAVARRAGDLRAQSVLGLVWDDYAPATSDADRRYYSTWGHEVTRTDVWLARIRNQRGLTGKASTVLGIFTPLREAGETRRPSSVAVARHVAWVLRTAISENVRRKHWPPPPWRKF